MSQQLTKYKLKHYQTGEIKHMTLKQILKNINEDRSEKWTPYNKRDWKEGLDVFTEWILIN